MRELKIELLSMLSSILICWRYTIILMLLAVIASCVPPTPPPSPTPLSTATRTATAIKAARPLAPPPPAPPTRTPTPVATATPSLTEIVVGRICLETQAKALAEDAQAFRKNHPTLPSPCAITISRKIL
ncbi:MAG: hypothetical protein U0401_29160 [Anaerolineae bacterium]